MLGSEPATGGSATIVNPSKLSPWLADNICVSCHQMGDARILQPDHDYRDFRPGTALKETLVILMVPPSREKPLESDLLEHYFSMTLSKCYGASGGRLGCITCHDPHVEPSASEAPAYFRGRCLSCHSEKSCAVPLTLRQRKNPPDDCAGCHMPKRDVRIISHSALTQHRIIAESGEAFPNVLSTPETPGLRYLNSAPGQDTPVSPLVLLEAYGQVMASHPEYREKYWNLARQLKTVQPDKIAVLRALADWATQQNSSDATGNAIEYLESAIAHGDTSPTDYEELARLLMARGRTSDVVKLLQRGLQDLPYDAEYYRLLGMAYLNLSRTSDAREILAKGALIFPEDSGIRELRKQADTSRAADARK
jgi:predicted CXXCH cytochrome family protein